jgi:uncharacterized protein (TIGR02246 family)
MKQERLSSAKWIVAAALAALTVSVSTGRAIAQQAAEGTEQAREIRTAVEAAGRDVMAIFARGDAAGLARAYTREALIMPANSDFIRGTTAIQALYQSLFDAGITVFVLEPLEIGGLGDTAYDVGRYELRGKTGETVDKGKYVLVWKREDGQWRIHLDIFTTSLPALQP